jgi:amino acid adenylation domain-containing protein
MHRLFEERAAESPGAVAVVCASRSLTYAEVDRRANHLARRLLSLGVGRGVNVGVVFERSVDLVVALMAVLKTGAAYVPLEPDYPAARKGYIVAMSRARLVLADRAYDVQALPEAAAPELVVLAPEELAAGDAERPELVLDPNDLAYTIYTSGSTGNPKGVMIEHHSAVNLIQWVNREYVVGPDTRILMLSSVCFDLSVWDIFGGLGAGATVVIARPGDLQDPGRLMRLVADERITFWSSVPSTLGLLVKYLEDVAPDYRQEDLRVIFLSGDWIPVSLPSRAHRFLPNARIVSLGGATEATVWSIYFPIDEVAPSWVSIPYGRPLDNNTFYILDADLDIVPPGVVGDLFIGGAGVAIGYANDPQKTANQFMPDRFAGVPGQRMYRTGDLGRMRPDGNIEFLGRADHQVKIRGFRVELGEIESQLSRHPEIREVVVVDRVDRSGEKYLCAYFVSPADLEAAELKRFLAASLPEYMTPATFVRLGALPLTANGKLDRKRLPEPDIQNLSTGAEYAAPSGEVESVLVAIWEEVLGVQGIGARHDYFALGGHSLSAVQVITHIRHHFGVELPLRSLFANPTIAGIAPIISGLREESPAPLGGLGIQRPRPDQLPLSFAQQRIWFLQQLNPKSTAFNLPLILRLSGQLDVPAFSAALGEVCRRHETLRTTFPQNGDGPVQRIAPARPQPLPCIDLAGLAPQRKERESRRLIDEELARTFDLGRGPLLRMCLLRLAEHEHVGLFHLHHIVADGWSMGLLSEEVAELYAAFAQGLPSPLPELPVQYADYTVWQLERLSGEELDRQLAYWRERLGGYLPALRLPSQRARPAKPSYRGQMEPIHLPGDLSEAARKLARQEGVTMFVLLLAAFKALLRLYTGQDDIVVGTVTANRSRIEIEKLIGFFVNTLALRTDLSGDPTFRELVARVRDVAFEAYEHQDVPFERLLETLELQRNGNTPVLPVKFQMQNFDGGDRELPGLTLAPFESPLETSQSDLSLMIAGEGEEGDIRGTIVYSTDLFEAGTIHRFARQLEDLLERCVAEPDRRLSSFSLLEEGEAEELIAAFNEI